MAILVISFIAFIYGTFKAISITNRTKIGTSEGIYTNYITSSNEIKEKAIKLTQNYQDRLFKVQSLLNFVTNIPYKTELFQQSRPLQTIKQNFGDCDDKSNLLISMLHSLDIEAYLVLVPKHIFVIVAFDDDRLSHIKGFWIDDKKYYILETTAKDSHIGFKFRYRIDEIDTILEPFTNKKLDYDKIIYK